MSVFVLARGYKKDKARPRAGATESRFRIQKKKKNGLAARAKNVRKVTASEKLGQQAGPETFVDRKGSTGRTSYQRLPQPALNITEWDILALIFHDTSAWIG